MGGKSSGVIVRSIVPGGVADRDGRLKSGDHILQLNDENLTGMASDQVANIIRRAGMEVKLIIARDMVEPVKPVQDPVRNVLPSLETVLEANLYFRKFKTAFFSTERSHFTQSLFASLLTSSLTLFNVSKTTTQQRQLP